MKKLLVISFFVISFSSVNAQTFVQSANDLTISKAGSMPTGTVYIQKNFNAKTKWGFSKTLNIPTC